MKGYIKLHRTILDWEWYKDTNTKIIESQQRKVEKRRANTILLQKKIDRLLDKVSDKGFDSLSEDEKDQLYVYSRRIGRDLKKD